MLREIVMRKNLQTQNNLIHSRSKRSLLSTTAMIAGALLASSQANAQVATPTNSWDYDVVLDGNVGKDTSVAGITDITVTGGNGFVEGNADIYTGHTVNVVGDSGSTFAYRDNRDDIQSTLDGDLNSNMNIVIIDKNGLFFGDAFRADVQGIVASTGSISVGDVMNGGELLIENISEGGSITLNGTITVAEAGLAAFVAPYVQNNGIINAKLARVQMGAAQTVTVDLHGDGLLELALDGELRRALIENNGRILAEGGTVQMTALAARKVAGSIVNNTGIINAASAVEVGGKIILSGGKHGTIRNTGAISTSEGGSVEISGKRFVQGRAESFAPSFSLVPVRKPVPAHSGQPYIQTAGGDVSIETSGDVEIQGGYIDAAGGDIDIDNEGTFYSANHNTLRTTGEGTIELNQNQPYHMYPVYENEEASVTPAAIYYPGPVASIQNAIDAINNTGTGTNTIDVGAGTYNEAVRIDHDNIVLNGANAGVHGRSPLRSPLETVIVPNSPGVYITADNAVVDGFEIVGGESGVRVNGGDNATIINNVIHDQYHPTGEGDSEGAYAAGDGIFVQNSTGTTIDSNYIHGMNDDGIHAVDVVDLTITKNVIYDAGAGDEGIAIAHASGDIVVDRNTIISARRDAIQLIDVDGVVSVSNNIMFHAGRSGINLVDVSGDVSVDENTIAYTGMGLDIVNSENVFAEGNDIHHVDLGAKVSSSSDITLEGNKINHAGEGILVKNSNYLHILANGIKSASNGIRFEDGMDGKRAFVYGNKIAAEEVGILIEGGVTNGSIINLGAYSNGNTIIAGDDGIRVEGTIEGSRVRITGSRITGGANGINFEDVGDDAVAAVWYNRNIVGKDGNGVVFGAVSSSTNSGASVVGNRNIVGSEDGVKVGDVNLATVAIVDNDFITGGTHGVHFAGNILDSSSSILIGDDSSDDTDSVITGEFGHGVFFAGDITNSNVIIGSGTVSTTSLGSTTSYEITADRGSVIVGGGDGVHFNGVISDESTITISDNKSITGNASGIQSDSDGVAFKGEVRDSFVNIRNNDLISGDSRGVSFEGFGSNADITGNSVITIAGNTIVGQGIDGVLFNSMDITAEVIIGGENEEDANHITGAQDGIDFENIIGGTISILGNEKIEGLSGDGIEFEKGAVDGSVITISDNASIVGADDGIDFDRSLVDSTLIISGNNIEAVNDGVHFDTKVINSTVTISGNNIEVGDDGIDFDAGALGSTINITGNTIVAGDVGVEFDPASPAIEGSRVIIRGNDIYADEGHGVAINGDIVDSLVRISANTSIDAGEDGVHIEGDISGRSRVVVRGNDYIEAGEDGVHIEGDISGRSRIIIRGNDYIEAGNNGVDVNNTGLPGSSARLLVEGNYIYDSGNTGVQVANIDTSILNNVIDYSGRDGVNIQGGSEVYVLDNSIYSSDDDGVDVHNASYVEVSGNEIHNSGDNGIHIVGNSFYPRKFTQESGLPSRGLTEIYLGSPTTAVVTDNIITNSGSNGIHTENIDDLTLVGNEVSNSSRHGIYVAGASNGFVTFQGNTLTDNGMFGGYSYPTFEIGEYISKVPKYRRYAAARFESGDIDMSDLDNPNTFINTTGIPAVAMQFDDVSSFYNPYPGEEVYQSEIRGYDYPIGNGLRIVGETLGSTVFDGYLPEESFYVRFEDGSILDPFTGEPIIIDAQNVSFDGVVPAASGGVLSAPTLSFIEDRLYDADDEFIDGRGQIFVGSVAVPAPVTFENFQDIFRNPEAGNGVSGGANLVITGLPSVGAFNLNNINPAAGGEEGEEVANIEPAAGNQEVTCIGDALGSLSGGSVSYSFGGSLADSISGAYACSTNGI